MLRIDQDNGKRSFVFPFQITNCCDLSACSITLKSKILVIACAKGRMLLYVNFNIKFEVSSMQANSLTKTDIMILTIVGTKIMWGLLDAVNGQHNCLLVVSRTCAFMGGLTDFN